MNVTSSDSPHSAAPNGIAMTSIAGIIVIFFLGFAGSLIPPLITKHFPKFDMNRAVGFRFFNGFAAGIVLAVGYIHSLPDAAESWSEVAGDSTSLTDTYAWFGFIAMMGGLICFFVEELVHRKVSRFSGLHSHKHEHDHDHDHDHNKDHPKEEKEHPKEEKVTDAQMEEGGATKKVEKMDVQSDINHADYFTELWVLFFGLSFHSIFVGLALGLNPSDWGLFAAIVFHQFFEGLALGARVARADFKKSYHFWLLDLAYAITVPIGIGIGMGIYTNVVHGSRTYSIINGIFQALSGGILIYVSTVHMMKEEMQREEFKGPGSSKILCALYVGFALGAGAMAVVGIWA